MTSPDEEIQTLRAQLSAMTLNSKQWRDRFFLLRTELDKTNLALKLSDDTIGAFNREATMRGTRQTDLATKILEHVAADNLFAAVLDQ